MISPNRAFLDRLSAWSLHRRFDTAAPNLETAARQWARPPTGGHVSLVAITGADHPLVGEASYEELRRDRAELSHASVGAAGRDRGRSGDRLPSPAPSATGKGARGRRATSRSLPASAERKPSPRSLPCGLPLVDQLLARTPEEAAEDAGRLQGPVALKGIAPGVIHETELQGVRLRLSAPAEVEAAARDMTQALAAAGHAVDGFLVQRMAPPGRDRAEAQTGAKPDSLRSTRAGAISTALPTRDQHRLLSPRPRRARNPTRYAPGAPVPSGPPYRLATSTACCRRGPDARRRGP